MSSEQPASSALLPLPGLPTHRGTVRHMPLDGDWLGICVQQHMYGLVLTERAHVAKLTTHTMQLSTPRIPATTRQFIQTRTSEKSPEAQPPEQPRCLLSAICSTGKTDGNSYAVKASHTASPGKIDAVHSCC